MWSTLNWASFSPSSVITHGSLFRPLENDEQDAGATSLARVHCEYFFRIFSLMPRQCINLIDYYASNITIQYPNSGWCLLGAADTESSWYSWSLPYLLPSLTSHANAIHGWALGRSSFGSEAEPAAYQLLDCINVWVHKYKNPVNLKRNAKLLVCILVSNVEFVWPCLICCIRFYAAFIFTTQDLCAS